jgi:hypothetical protein
MQSLLTSLLIGAVGAIALAIVALRAKRFGQDLEAATQANDRYYAAAQRLIKDPSTDEVLIGFIEWFAHQVVAPDLARRFLFDLATGRLARRGAPPASDFSRALSKLKREQQQDFAEMMLSGLVTSAASDAVFSGLFKTIIALYLSQAGTQADHTPSIDRAKTAALDLSGRASLVDCAA